MTELPVQPDGSLQVTAKNCDQPLEVLTISAASSAVVSIVAVGATA
jgi:hypothetical protein